MPAPYFAHKTLLRRGDGGGPEVFTLIPDVQSIEGPTLTRDTIDVTSHSTTGNAFIEGLRNFGTVAAEILFDPDDTVHEGLLADHEAGTRRNFELEFTDTGPAIWSFTAIISSFSISAPTDDALKASLELTLTAAPTRA